MIAPIYDWFDLLFLLDPGRNPREALARKIPNSSLHILDVCAGTAGASVKIARKQLRNINLLEMDATKMELDDGVFDVATVSFGLHEMPRELMVRALAEIARVVKPSGKLYIVDYEKEGGPLRRIAFATFLRVNRSLLLLQTHGRNAVAGDLTDVRQTGLES